MSITSLCYRNGELPREYSNQYANGSDGRRSPNEPEFLSFRVARDWTESLVIYDSGVAAVDNRTARGMIYTGQSAIAIGLMERTITVEGYITELRHDGHRGADSDGCE